MNPYSTLGLDKNASEADIKKAYRKKAMQWHPDKNKGNKEAETKFKEINNAYDTLKDPKKKQQYDTFGSAGANFGGGGAGGTSGFNSSGFSGFEDIFSNFSQGGASRQSSSSSAGFDFSDMFGSNGGSSSGFSNQERKPKEKKEEINLDVEENILVPIIDLMLGTKISVKTVYNENININLKAGTKPGKKLRVKGKGRTDSGKTGDLFVKIDAKMPENIPDDIRRVLEDIKYRL